MKTKQLALLVSLFILTILSAIAQEPKGYVIYDFEQPWQYEQWTTGKVSKQEIIRSEKYCTSGKKCVGYKAEMSPFEQQLRVLVWENDWDPYDYIGMNVVNPTDKEINMDVFFGERNGYQFSLTLPAMSAKRYYVKIKFPKFQRKNNIIYLIYKVRPEQSAEFYIDDIALYKQGELKTFDAKTKKIIEFKGDRMENEIGSIQQTMHGMIKKNIIKRVDEFSNDLDRIQTELPELKQRFKSLSKYIKMQASDRDKKTQENATLRSRYFNKAIQRIEQIGNYVKIYTGNKELGFLVGFSDPMTKVLPKEMPLDLDITQTAKVSLAGNEKEAIQLTVVPFSKDAKDVTITVSDLRGPDNKIISSENINCDLMSYVKTTKKTTPGVEYVGWWPDPIIANPKSVDVALGNVQTWWLRVRAPKNQKAGRYKGTINVHSKNGEPLKFNLEVTVYGFNMPPHAPIPTAITYKGFGETPMTSDPETWKTLKYQHADLLADNMIDVDDLYRSTNPDKSSAVDWELMTYLKQKGQLVAFNLGYFWGGGDKHMQEFKVLFDKAKELGLEKHCYIYGNDERPRSDYDRIAKASEKLKQTCPGALIMTTAQDHSYGFNTQMKDVTAWCPIINRINPTLAIEARKVDKRVWWYTCIWPSDPYPNIFVDYPAVDNRQLGGFMQARYKPDGYLYYHTVIWKGGDRATGITTYPYTNWQPYNFLDTNGDGSLLCIDSEGNLVPTIRIENLRDGFEDLAYYMILEYKLKKCKELKDNKNEKWIDSSEKVLSEIDTMVHSQKDIEKDPNKIYVYRNKLAKLIEQSPIKDDDPWKGKMGAWGISRD